MNLLSRWRSSFKKKDFKKDLVSACGQTLVAYGLFCLTSFLTPSNFQEPSLLIPIVKEEVPLHQPLKKHMVTFQEVSPAKLQKLFPSEKDLKQGKFWLREGLSEHDVLLKQSLAPEPSVSFDEKIPLGMRLYTLNVNHDLDQSHIQCNSHVDLIATIRFSQGERITVTLLEDLVVQQKCEGRKLAFFLTPDQIKLVVYAENLSEFTVFLRNPKDTLKVSQDTSMTFKKFLANPRIRSALESNFHSGVRP